MPIAITIRHRFLIGMASETIIDISPESLSTSVRNDYRHRPESATTDAVLFFFQQYLRPPSTTYKICPLELHPRSHTLESRTTTVRKSRSERIFDHAASNHGKTNCCSHRYLFAKRNLPNEPDFAGGSEPAHPFCETNRNRPPQRHFTKRT